MKSSKVILFTGPSGVGKATIENSLFSDQFLNLGFSISATTREKRPSEVEGLHYYFISEQEFKKRIEGDEFLEWNEHFGHKYGTLKSEIVRIKSEGKRPFLEIEVNGVENIVKKLGRENVISIFIAPPSIADLEKRIKARGAESDAQISDRIERANHEMEQAKLFDFVVVNDDLKEAVSLVKKIIGGN